MARKRKPILTEGELRLMQVVWDRDEATVHDVMAALPSDQNPAYNTILTIMRILEKKGYLLREKKGRAHLYRALITREQARKKAITHMIKSMFDGSPEELMLSILKNQDLGREEIGRLKEMIFEKEKE